MGDFFNLISPVFINAITVVYFYCQIYSAQIILLGLLTVAGIIEYKEKRFLTVDDERRVI